MRFRCKKWRSFVAFETIEFTWFFQLRCLLMITPKYLALLIISSSLVVDFVGSVNRFPFVGYS